VPSNREGRDRARPSIQALAAASANRLKPALQIHAQAVAPYRRESIAANSASTISRTSCGKVPTGFQPSVLRILSALPTRRLGSVGRSNIRPCRRNRLGK